MGELTVSTDKDWKKFLDKSDFVDFHDDLAWAIAEFQPASSSIKWCNIMCKSLPNKVSKDENELIKPSFEGTLRAVRAAKKTSVKRIVVTSSIVAILGNINESIAIDQDT